MFALDSESSFHGRVGDALDVNWGFAEPFLLTNQSWAAEALSKDPLAGFAKDFQDSFEISTLKITDGRATHRLPDACRRDILRKFGGATPGIYLPAVTQVNGIAIDSAKYQQLDTAAAPTIFTVVSNHIGPMAFEQSELSSIRITTKGTRSVALVNASDVLKFLHKSDKGKDIKLHSLKPWLSSATSETWKSFMQEG